MQTRPARRHAWTLSVLMWGALAPACAAADEPCGFVTAANKPPQSKGVYPAEIARIDGVDVPKRKVNRIRLAAGKHNIAIQERIGTTPRGDTVLRKLGNREAPLVYKVIEINVEADTLYQIGAQLDEKQVDPEKPDDYWTPTIWRKSVEACR